MASLARTVASLARTVASLARTVSKPSPTKSLPLPPGPSSASTDECEARVDGVGWGGWGIKSVLQFSSYFVGI